MFCLRVVCSLLPCCGYGVGVGLITLRALPPSLACPCPRRLLTLIWLRLVSPTLLVTLLPPRLLAPAAPPYLQLFVVTGWLQVGCWMGWCAVYALALPCSNLPSSGNLRTVAFPDPKRALLTYYAPSLAQRWRLCRCCGLPRLMPYTDARFCTG